jgi:hypothetical protein
MSDGTVQGALVRALWLTEAADIYRRRAGAIIDLLQRDGWVIVPETPTPAMEEAVGWCHSGEEFADVWRNALEGVRRGLGDPPRRTNDRAGIDAGTAVSEAQKASAPTQFKDILTFLKTLHAERLEAAEAAKGDIPSLVGHSVRAAHLADIIADLEASAGVTRSAETPKEARGAPKARVARDPAQPGDAQT